MWRAFRALWGLSVSQRAHTAAWSKQRSGFWCESLGPGLCCFGFSILTQMGSIPTARCSPRESPGPWRTPWLPSSYRLRDEETEAQRGFAMGHVCLAAERPRSWDRSPWGPKPCFGVALPGGAERRCWGPLELRPPWETPQLQQQQAHMLGPAPGPGRRAGAMQSQPSSAGPGETGRVLLGSSGRGKASPCLGVAQGP